MVSRRPLLLAAMWLIAAATATSVGLLAVHLVGNEVGAQVAAPLDDEGILQALGSLSPTPAHTPQPKAEQPGEHVTTGRARTVVTAGGVVSARCSDGAPQLVYATPADGFRTDRGTSSITFTGAGLRLVLTMTCSGTELHAAVVTHRVGSPPAASPSPAPVLQPSPTDAPEPSDAPDSTGGSSHSEPSSVEGH